MFVDVGFSENGRLALAGALFALLLSVVVLFAPVPVAANGVIYVDASATGNDNGNNWNNAYTNLQDALAAATSGDEIWVAAGTYYPDEGSGQTDNDDTSTFQLINEVAIYGGFSGTETARSQRDWEQNTTLLSGDIDQNDDPFEPYVDSDSNQNTNERTDHLNGNNTEHVVTADGTDNTAILDGFTISFGRTISGGGGINNLGGNPSLTNLVISGNHAVNEEAGGMKSVGSPSLNNVTFQWNTASSGAGMDSGSGSPTLTNVTFRENSATYSRGGGMSNSSSSLRLTNVTFTGNSALLGGGGMANFSSNPSLNNVTFDNNVAGELGGGGLYNSSSNPVLTNVTFTGNSANSGGGMANFSSNPVLTNVTFTGNSSGLGGGIYNVNNSSPVLTNVTFTNNTSGSYGGAIYNSNSNPTISVNTFNNNSATAGGGAIYNTASSPDISLATFEENSSTAYGGGIYNDNGSHPAISYAVFEANTATTRGGAMYNDNGSNPIVSYTTFSNNSATNRAGAIYNDNSSAPTVSYATFSGNSANRGGAVYNIGDSSSIWNHVTFSNNTATISGGAFHNVSSDPSFNFTTINENESPGDSASLYSTGGALSLTSSVIANSAGGGDCLIDSGGVSDGGNNWIEDGSCSAYFATATGDPDLGALADNGGATLTHRPNSSSGLIDSGGSCSGLDQRGAVRPYGVACDIGAVETREVLEISSAGRAVNLSAGSYELEFSSGNIVVVTLNSATAGLDLITVEEMGTDHFNANEAALTGNWWNIMGNVDSGIDASITLPHHATADAGTRVCLWIPDLTSGRWDCGGVTTTSGNFVTREGLTSFGGVTTADFMTVFLPNVLRE